MVNWLKLFLPVIKAIIEALEKNVPRGATAKVVKVRDRAAKKLQEVVDILEAVPDEEEA